MSKTGPYCRKHIKQAASHAPISDMRGDNRREEQGNRSEGTALLGWLAAPYAGHTWCTHPQTSPKPSDQVSGHAHSKGKENRTGKSKATRRMPRLTDGQAIYQPPKSNEARDQRESQDQDPRFLSSARSSFSGHHPHGASR